MSTHVWWYLARASGVVAWALLSMSVLWGVLLTVHQPGVKPRPAWLLDLHRWLGSLAVTFTGFHLAGLFLDSYVGFRLEELFVPFASHWHPIAVAWGIIAFWFLAAVQITSLLRSRMSVRWWHAVHMTSYGLFWVASVHAITAGADANNRAFGLLAMTVMIVVAVSTLRRIRFDTAAVRTRPRR